MNADTLIYLAVIIVIAVFIQAVLKKSVGNYRYRMHAYLLTKAELNFFRNLQKHLPREYGISCKVRLADILQPAEKGKRYRAALARIWSKHLDFVIYEMNSGKIISAIELDDQSHLKTKRVLRDKFLNSAAEQSQLILHRVTNKPAWSSNDILRLLPGYTERVNLQGLPPL